MAEIITTNTRKAIKKMAEITQLSNALCLMPKAEDFAIMLIGDMRKISDMINRISIRINDVLQRYSDIPVEFLLKGFDEILERLDNINVYAKYAIAETTEVMSNVVNSVGYATDSVGNALSTVTSATLQIGGGLSYGAVAMGANITLAVSGNGRRVMTNDVVRDAVDGELSMEKMKNEFENRIYDAVGDIDNVADSIRNWTETAVSKSTGSIDGFFENIGEGIGEANKWIEDTAGNANDFLDNITEKVENAKIELEEKIDRVKQIFENLQNKFDESFGFINGKNFAEETFMNISNTAIEKMDGAVFDEIGELSKDIANLLKILV
jgi:gas vesicle protein